METGVIGRVGAHGLHVLSLLVEEELEVEKKKENVTTHHHYMVEMIVKDHQNLKKQRIVHPNLVLANLDGIIIVVPILVTNIFPQRRLLLMHNHFVKMKVQI